MRERRRPLPQRRVLDADRMARPRSHARVHGEWRASCRHAETENLVRRSLPRPLAARHGRAPALERRRDAPAHRRPHIESAASVARARERSHDGKSRRNLSNKKARGSRGLFRNLQLSLIRRLAWPGPSSRGASATAHPAPASRSASRARKRRCRRASQRCEDQPR